MFSNRVDAGVQLARRLEHVRADHPVIIGLPRGGVPVACQVARALKAQLDVIIVRKLGVPFQPELAMGAISERGKRVINQEVVEMAHISDDDIADVENMERRELDRRARRYRAGRDRIPLSGRVVIAVDDGIATGSTARVACQVAREEGARRVVLAVPVAPADWFERMAGVADELISVATPDNFFGIGRFYQDFSATSDEEVVRCLNRAVPDAGAPGTQTETVATDPTHSNDDIVLEIGAVSLRGHLTVPEVAKGVVIFAHGTGSSRHSPRNRYVASVLNEAGLATLLFDLLTQAEEADRANVFDVELLARRLVEVTGWVGTHTALTGLAIGYFGASTGAAAALWAAAEPEVDVAAVVSRGGRPDLAGARLEAVRAATLLIVGGHDDVVLRLNRAARAKLRCESRMDVVPGATHLFAEAGTLQTAAERARDWFITHLTSV